MTRSPQEWGIHRVGIVSTRLAGTDGVSLRAENERAQPPAGAKIFFLHPLKRRIKHAMALWEEDYRST